MSPSPEGLGRLYANRVAAEPDAFASLADRITQLDPTYVGFTMQGLHDAAKSALLFDWSQALKLADVTVAAPERVDGGGAADRDRDPGWGWGRREAASLLKTGLSELLILRELAGPLWEVLDQLSLDPEPSADYAKRYGGLNMDALTLSLNTVRGQAMHAVIQFAVWMRQEASDEHDLLAAVLANVDAHLDLDRETSETVRAVLGVRLAQLHWLDPKWLAERLDALFPAGQGHRQLRIATWQAYVSHGKVIPELCRLLEPQ
jgi:hypothetical protein